MFLCPYTFLSLPVEEQLKALWAEGIYLAARWEKQHRVYLYSTGAFFTEVYCDLGKSQRLSTRAFTSVQHLEDYACYIKLPDLPL